MSLSKKLRFEVFKRDAFTCQYCGRKAPDVILEVDHIQPRANGGEDDILNLVTSCYDCNRGKGARTLDDASVVEKQRRQLEELQERREQLDMMVEWQRSLHGLEETTRDEVGDFWKELMGGDWGEFTDAGRADVRNLVRRFGVAEVLEAMRIAADTYVRFGEEDRRTIDSMELAWSKVGGICHNRKKEREDPEGYAADQVMWRFVRAYRRYSNYPPNWRLCKWWRALIEVDPDADPFKVVDEIVDNYRTGSGGAYFDGALEILEDG